MRNLIRNEPVMISGLVEAIIILFVSFGADLSAEQVGSILGVVAILTSVVARAFVTPTNKA